MGTQKFDLLQIIISMRSSSSFKNNRIKDRKYSSFKFTSTKKETDVDVMVSTEKNFGEAKKSWKSDNDLHQRSLFSQVYELDLNR